MTTDNKLFGMIFGKSGIGKTTLLYDTMDAQTTLMLNAEGESVSKRYTGMSFEIKKWSAAKDLAVLVCGPNPALPAGTFYSPDHYLKAAHRLPDQASVNFKESGIEFLFIDSLTSLARMAFLYAKAVHTHKTTKEVDMRAAYQLLASEFMAFLMHFKNFSPFHMWFTCVLEEKYDENFNSVFVPQIESAKLGAEIISIFDEILTLVPDVTKKTRHKFVTDLVNPYKVPAKDRSNLLLPLEEANLYKVSHLILGYPRPQEIAPEPEVEVEDDEAKKIVKSFLSEAIEEMSS